MGEVMAAVIRRGNVASINRENDVNIYNSIKSRNNNGNQLAWRYHRKPAINNVASGVK
jgi:hypothetical protein